MTPTEILKHEHQIILLVLKGAEREGTAARKKGACDAQTVEKMADFFKMFVDRCHHAKEERHLFPALERHGVPREGGPIGVMLSEHDAGRGQVRAIAAALPGLKAGRRDAAAAAADALLAYAALLRAHIEKEEGVLFAIADRLLTPKECRDMVKAFDRVEAEEIGEGVHEKYHQLAYELAGH
ncbi:MAG: hemerythrin domain-containing protein [Candidatus Brocadiia bacterium]|jgi:hemerythrin-like domain-containing protein